MIKQPRLLPLEKVAAIVMLVLFIALVFGVTTVWYKTLHSITRADVVDQAAHVYKSASDLLEDIKAKQQELNENNGVNHDEEYGTNSTNVN